MVSVTVLEGTSSGEHKFKVDMVGLNTNIDGDSWLADSIWQSEHKDDAIDIHARIGHSRKLISGEA